MAQAKNNYRLNRFLARSGIASRRKSDLLIQGGKVSVNGKIVTVPGFRVSNEDKVMYRGQTVKLQPFRTAALNKPHGFETTLSPDSKRSILKLIKGLPSGTVPVGRLDINTGGLLILSNDGELVNRLTHPSWEVEREYRIFLKNTPNSSVFRSLRRGASIGSGEFSKPLSVEPSGKKSVNLVLRTGRNREVRRLFEACDIQFEGLERVRYGPVTLKGIERGEWRLLVDDELKTLMKAVKLVRE
ncbi:MAG: rRNA pseudouridine synthase [Candidatus Aegiribacteria sp.]|nr:rRNA pseudouridine synthase [Candidatus Aegiribacteria sp.]